MHRARVKDSIKASEKMGGKVLGVYITTGEYDLVAISEWPNDEAAAAMILAQGALGNVRTTSLKAFTPDEFAKIVARLP